MIKNKLFTIVLLVIMCLHGFAQTPKINEYSCANVSGTGIYQDFSGGTPDWFEIYNPRITPLDISGYYVSNDPTFVGKWQFPIGTIIPAQGFLLVYASGKDTVVAGLPIQYHTNFDLLQTKGEKIILANLGSVIQDSVTIRRHKPNDAWARIPNGSSTWRVYSHSTTNVPTATPGASNTGVKHWSGYLPSPTFSLQRGFYSGPQTLELQMAGTIPAINPHLYYTGAGPSSPRTGKDPSIFGNTYKQEFLGPPLAIDSSTVIRAYVDTAVLADANTNNNTYKLLPSFVETYSYIIDNPNPPGISTNFQLPVVSMGYDTTTTGQYPGGTGIAATYMLSLEYFDKNKNYKFNSIGRATGGSADQIVVANKYAGFDFAANDEYGYNYTNKQQFYTDPGLGTSGRTEQTTIKFQVSGDDVFPFGVTQDNNFSTHMRDAVSQTYAMKNGLHLDGSHYQPCIMYLNGKYIGIYEIREAFDNEYVKYYYGLGGGIIKGELRSLEKDGALSSSPNINAAYDWGNVADFIVNQDMQNDSLRAIADSLLDFRSLIDLIIYNSYTVNAGFPTKAAWWRYHDTLGHATKWRYRMFDMDDTYGLDKNDAGLANTAYDASVCQHETQFKNQTDSSLIHLAVFYSLMESDTFKSQFINRYSYLLNNVLKCDPIIGQVNYIKGILNADMPLHSTKLSTNLTLANDTVWRETCVDTLKYYISQRCTTLREDIKTCYNVTGPFSFCTSIEPTIAGAVVLNSVSYPEEHSDYYFGNVYFTAVAVPNENYYFDHWEPESFTLPAAALTNDSIMWKFDSISCLKAVFKLKEPYNLTGEPSVPTGFSPNGDGNNDVLNVYGTINTTDFHLEVYNRWGQKMFESNDKTQGWNGTYKGQEAPIGVYAYVFKVTLADGKQLQKSGSITLIR